MLAEISRADWVGTRFMGVDGSSRNERSGRAVWNEFLFFCLTENGNSINQRADFFRQLMHPERRALERFLRSGCQ